MRFSVGLYFLLFSSCVSLAQSPPTVPKNLGFAGLNIQLTEGTRAIVQADVNALMVNKKYWEATLDKCLLYFPIIEGIMIDEDVPTDFKYLVVQESALQPDAVSPSNAVGFWQFKQETALDYGLRIDNEIDERKNINASTQAAARYLKKSNAQFNNWVASLYSYYLGAGTIAKLIPSDWSYARQLTLDENSDKYLLRFFAHKIAIEASIGRYQPTNQQQLVEYPKSAGRTLQSIARELDVDYNLLKSYNKWLLVNEVPSDKKYVAIIPSQGLEVGDIKAKVNYSKSEDGSNTMFAQNDIGFPVLRRSGSGSSIIGPILYEINGLPGIMATNGDDIQSISNKSQVSYGSFLRYNDMQDGDPVKPGDVYYLGKKLKKAAVPYHTTREGESLWKVAQIYGMRLKCLVKYNRINNINQRLQAGRVLWLMENRPRNTPIEVVQLPAQPTPSAPRKSQPRPAVQEENEPKPAPKPANERKVYTPKMADTPPPKPTTPPPSIVVSPTPTQKNELLHPVELGQTYFSIARMYEVSVKDIFLWNNLAPEAKLQAGQKLLIKTVGKTIENQPAAKEDFITHTVDIGENLFRIAQKYNVKTEQLREWNDLGEDEGIKVGQQLKIKKP